MNSVDLDELERLAKKPIRTIDELIILAYAVPELVAIAQYLAGRCADMDADLGNEDAMTADEWLELAKLNAKRAGE